MVKCQYNNCGGDKPVSAFDRADCWPCCGKSITIPVDLGLPLEKEEKVVEESIDNVVIEEEAEQKPVKEEKPAKKPAKKAASKKKGKK